MVYMLLSLGYITQEEFKRLYDTSRHITKLLMSFVKSINAADKKRNDSSHHDEES